MNILKRIWRPVAIAAIPLLGISVLDEYVPGLVLYAWYAASLFAVAAVSVTWLSPAASAVAAGVLGTGSILTACFAVVGTVAAIFLLVLSLPFLGSARSQHDAFGQSLRGIFLVLLCLSPWLTSLSLGELAVRSLRFSQAQIGRLRAATCALVGLALTAALMTATMKADGAWLAPRVQVFETGDPAAWESSLSEIKQRWLCGHRRCLMSVCYKLMARFGETVGERGPFASPFGFATVAPDVPSDLARPFENVYGYPFRQVCAIGD